MSLLLNRDVRRIFGLCWAISMFAITCTLDSACLAATSPSSASGIVLRVRLPDGNIERLHVPGSSMDLPLSDILRPLGKENLERMNVHHGDQCILQHSNDDDKSECKLASLGLKNGALLTLRPGSTKESKLQKRKTETPGSASFSADRWDPFPDLAKDYRKALIKTKRKRATGVSSYSVLSDVQSELHVVEAQNEGPIQRVYVCGTSAATFQSNCIHQKKQTIKNRVGFLFGKIHRERKNERSRPKTSLSSTTDADDYCQSVRIHAVWEPPQQDSEGAYDESALSQPIPSKVLNLAQALDIKLVGWVYTYTDDRNNDDDALPVLGQDIRVGSKLQIQKMKEHGRSEGCQFVTLAMQAKDGVTEAFQMSDVAVQMTAEGLFDQAKGRTVQSNQPVVVNGAETSDFDSVLCLVNTAMLSHDGSFACKQGTVKKNGSLTAKARKRLQSLLNTASDTEILVYLSDFGILLALSDLLSGGDFAVLSELVKNFQKGRKKTSSIDPDLKKKLATSLEL